MTSLDCLTVTCSDVPGNDEQRSAADKVKNGFTRPTAAFKDNSQTEEEDGTETKDQWCDC